MSHSSYLLLNDVRVHYLRWGLGQTRPVLMLHGLASNARIWELAAPYLASAGFDLVAPDARGHGLTDKPDGDYGFKTFSGDLAALINALEFERPLLVGHSWGALLALDYAVRFSVGQRSPLGIVLVDGAMAQLDASGSTWEEIRQRLTPPRLAGMAQEDFLARLAESGSRWGMPEQAQQIILANFEISPEETIAPHLTFERHMQIVRAMWEFQTYSQFTRLRCPALLVPSRPPEPRSEAEQTYLALKEQGVERILKALPGVRVHWMEDTIHDSPLQRPAELAQVITEFASSLA